MATVIHTLAQGDSQDHVYKRLGTIIITWSSLGQGDSGDWVDVSNYADFTVQAKGTFSGSGRADLQGSNDSGTTAVQLLDLDGNSVQFSVAGMDVVRESPQMIRPTITSGDVSTAITVILVGKR